jgi:hypothetical protein
MRRFFIVLGAIAGFALILNSSFAQELVELVSPAPGSVINTDSVTFNWTTDSNVSEYWLGVGTTQESLRSAPWGDIFAETLGASSSVTVNDIPLDVGEIHVRLWYKVGGNWLFNDYSYQTRHQLKHLLWASFYPPRAFEEIDEDVLNSLNESPYTGVGIRLVNYFDSDPPPTFESYQDKINFIGTKTGKNIWPWVFFNRFVGGEQYKSIGSYECEQNTHVSDEYFRNIPLMDIYNEYGTLEDFYKIYETSLKVAKELGAPGIMIDPETYHNYCAARVTYLAEAHNKSSDEIQAQLRNIGRHLADLTDQHYPDAVLLSFYYDPQFSSYRNTSNIFDGILERSEEMGYRLNLVDGGETVANQVYRFFSYDDYLTQSSIWLEGATPTLVQYPENYRLSNTLAPYKDIRTLHGNRDTNWFIKWYEDNISEVEVITIEDHVPLFQDLFQRYEYVWIYGAGAANYNLFDINTDAPVINSKIQQVLNEVSHALVTPRPILTSTPTPTPTPTPTFTPTPAPTPFPSSFLRIDGQNSSTKRQLETFNFSGGFFPNRDISRYIKSPSSAQFTKLSPDLKSDSGGNVSWSFTSSCQTPVGTYQLYAIDQSSNKTSNTVYENIVSNPSCTAKLEIYGLKEGDLISVGDSDPDIFIVNEYGYKRLFLNPVIFNFYGHLGGFQNVKGIPTSTRDVFETLGLFRNCETNDPKIYAVEVTAEDMGTLHWVDIDAATTLNSDPNFFNKVFCINNNEFNWYPKSDINYTSLSQIPIYKR